MKAQKKNRSFLKVRSGIEVRWEQPEEAKEIIADLRTLHLEFIGAVETPAMGFVKMAAYRANTQRVYLILHDDAQELWLDIFSLSKAEGGFFSVTNASGPLIGLVAQRPTYFVSHRLAKTPPKALYREFLRIRPKRDWDEASNENLPLAYEMICKADSRWQEEHLQGDTAEKVMQKLMTESYAAAKSLRRSDPVSELRHLLHDLRQGEPPKGLPANLTSAATEGNLEMVKLFLKNGSDLYERTGYGFPLSAAAQFGRLAVVDYLLSQGADPARENYGMSPISKAAGHGHGLVVQRLLKAGVPEDQRKAALENAKGHRHSAIVRLLEGKPVTDAELGKPSKSRKPSLKDVMDESTLLMGREPEDEPLPEGKHESARKRVLELLENDQVKERMDYFFKDRDTYYGSYLGLAIKTGDMDLVKRILAMSAREVISRELLTATKYANTEAIELLLAAGANPNPSGKRGYSALMVAAEMGNPELVRRLLVAGSDPKFRTDGGETAMTKACGPFQKEIESILKSAAAQPKKSAAESSIKTQGKSKGDPSKAKGCAEFRDALYSGQPEWAVACIEAPCAAVADAFAKLHPKAKRHADTANRVLEAGLPAIMILQLKGQPWTILVRTIGWLEMEDLKGLPEDAKALSAALKTRAITYMAEDTSSAEAYEIYENGKSIENACQADEFEFKSSWRKKPKFGDDFPEPTFTDLGIYLPEIWLDNDGYNTSLVLGGIKAAAVDRLDCLEIKAK